MATPYSNLFNLTSQWNAAPSATKAGTVASGGAYGSTLPGKQYPSNAMKSTKAVLGASTQNQPKQGSGFGGLLDLQTAGGTQSYSPSVGGGGGSAPVAQTPYYDASTGQTFGSIGDFEGVINSFYDETSGLLNAQEQGLRSGEQDLYTQATAPYEAQRPALDQAYQEGQTMVEQGKQGVRKDEANALSEARRLYQELNQAGIQRFGGSSSAGEFANSLVGREFQRNVGKAFDTAGQNIQKLVEKGLQVKQNYDAQLQSLETQKTAALAQARDTFRQRLDQINNARIGLAENRAQMKLSALQQLRSEAFAIQQQVETFRQNLITQSQQADLNLRNAIQSYRASNGNPVDLAQFGNSTYSQYGNTGGTTSTGVYQGGIQAGKKFNPLTGRYE